MLKKISYFAFVMFLSTQGLIHSDATDTEQTHREDPSFEETSQENHDSASSNDKDSKPYPTFTGKVIGKQVRMRLQPTLEGHVVGELSAGDLFLVTAERENFYQVRPPRGTKFFVFRTFILDEVVEGNHVNVRLEPHLESPVVAQLNTGDRVTGIQNPDNGKWLQIDPPEQTQFYIAKEYVQQVGDENYLSLWVKKEKEVNHLLNSAYLMSQSELRKSFEEVDFENMTRAFERITQDYQEFPEHVAKAKEALEMIQDTYLQKKIAFLETQSQTSSSSWKLKNSQLNAQMDAYQQRLSALEEQLSNARSQISGPLPSSTLSKSKEPAEENVATKEQATPEKSASMDLVTSQMRIWEPMERAYFHIWAAENHDQDIDIFAQKQEDEAQEITGIIEPYYRPVKNKPGDYILRNPINSLPIAYIYSTKVNLQERVGQQVLLKATERPNNNFAYPAYHVWSVE